MITRLAIRDFKRLGKVDIELGRHVVFIGPNNSGKSSALQAIALWDLGLWSWIGSPGGQDRSRSSAVAIGRKDIISAACPKTILLWRDLKTRNKANHILFEISVEGFSSGKRWSCGLEFDYANPEFLYCRPKRNADGSLSLPPKELALERVAYLQPMSGLASVEPKLETGYVNVLIGQGQTAQVLRNLCYQLCTANPAGWNKLVGDMRASFGVEMHPPELDAVRGELTMNYNDRNGIPLDISSSGRGMHQTLLLLAYLYSNPNHTILLDEPDAHLEVLRQRQIYQMLSSVAEAQRCQIITASHSEVVLEEAAGKEDSIVAFVGKPHLIRKTGEIQKALKEICFEDYYQAISRGWVLYLEGASDLALLKAFAKLVRHNASEALEAPFVHYLRNNVPNGARRHFHGLREARGSLYGLALFDKINNTLNDNDPEELMWKKREFENYICSKAVLLRWAKGDFDPTDLIESADAEKRVDAMETCIGELENALRIMGKGNPWDDDIKASDDFLVPLFRRYAETMDLPPQTMEKSNFSELVRFIKPEEVDVEIINVLDKIVEVAKKVNLDE